MSLLRGWRDCVLALSLVVATVGCAAQSPPPSDASAPAAGSPGRLFADFLALPDGPAPTRFTSGQPATLAPTPDDWEKLKISDGRLTLLTSAPERRAGYLRSPDMGRPIERLGAQWTIRGKQDGGPGVAAFGVTGSPVDPLRDANAPMSMHLLIESRGWNYSISQRPVAGDPRLIQLAQGRFDPPLVEDGVTTHRVDVTFAGPEATIALPDGTTTRVSDPRIAAWAGRFGFFEAYAEAGVRDGVVGFTRVWIDS